MNPDFLCQTSLAQDLTLNLATFLVSGIQERQDAGMFYIQAATTYSWRIKAPPLLAHSPHCIGRRIYARPAPAQFGPTARQTNRLFRYRKQKIVLISSLPRVRKHRTTMLIASHFGCEGQVGLPILESLSLETFGCLRQSLVLGCTDVSSLRLCTVQLCFQVVGHGLSSLLNYLIK